MIAKVQLDPSNRIVLSKVLRLATGFARGQKIKASAGSGRIVLELEANANGKVAKRGKLKVWTGVVPALPLAEAVEHSRRYERWPSWARASWSARCWKNTRNIRSV